MSAWFERYARPRWAAAEPYWGMWYIPQSRGAGPGPRSGPPRRGRGRAPRRASHADTYALPQPSSTAVAPAASSGRTARCRQQRLPGVPGRVGPALARRRSLVRPPPLIRLLAGPPPMPQEDRPDTSALNHARLPELQWQREPGALPVNLRHRRLRPSQMPDLGWQRRVGVASSAPWLTRTRPLRLPARSASPRGCAGFVSWPAERSSQ
jgi:hypothetical protein